MGANLGHGRLASASSAAREHEFLVVATRRRPAGRRVARPTTGRTGMLTAGLARHVERRGVRHRAHPATRLARDLERRRAFGDERGRRRRRREQDVDLVEDRGDRRRAARRAAASQFSSSSGVRRSICANDRARHRRDVVGSARARFAVVTRHFEARDDRPRASWARELHVDVDELETRVRDKRERGFVRELLDFGIAHREAERRRPGGLLAPQCFDGRAREQCLLVRARRLRQRRRIDHGRSRDRVDVARGVAHRPAHRSRHRGERVVERRA